jgi:hypothetical protein
MKEIFSLWGDIAEHAFIAVILSGILCAFLVLPAAAETPSTFIMKWVEKTNGPVEKLGGQNIYGGTLYLPEIIPEPPYVTDNPANMGSYAGPCPIGGTAPQLRKTGLSTGALCRGACGINCPEERCRPVADVKIAAGGGVCTYTNVVSCNSHAGCRDHDACYDYCSEVQKESSLAFGSCHGVCNSRCYRDYGLGNCIIWAALPGSASSTLGLMTDVVTAPLTDKYLIFSDEPEFTPDTPKTGTSGSQPCDSINPYDCWTMKDR